MKLVIFDCDGTLVDSQHMICAAMDRAFDANGLGRLLPAAVLDVVGLSLGAAICRLIPDAHSSLVEKVAEDYKGAFQELRRSSPLEEPLYEGIRELLHELAGRERVVLGVATGKSRRGLDIVLAREGLTALFRTLQTADTHPSKPNPSMILAAMAEAGAEPRDTVMVGDTTFDVEMALAAGVSAVGVAWGYHRAEKLAAAGAHDVVTEPALLGSALAPYVSLVEAA